jgi:phosphate starvation-inducible PhoH-like protein
MATKRALRKKKESGELQQEFVKAYEKNFNTSNINLKKMFPLTDNHQKFYYLSQQEKTNMIFLDGPAGSMKSYLAVYSAIELLKAGKVDRIIYVRTVVESSSKSMGFLKGDENMKLAPYVLPLLEKAYEATDKHTVDQLLELEYLKAIPVNFARGLTFNNSAVIFDESQNGTRTELATILTRFGRNSKYFIIGDSKQSDITASGFNKVSELFDTEHSRKNNIHCMKFDVGDICRSNILKHISAVLGV